MKIFLNCEKHFQFEPQHICVCSFALVGANAVYTFNYLGNLRIGWWFLFTYRSFSAQLRKLCCKPVDNSWCGLMLTTSGGVSGPPSQPEQDPRSIAALSHCLLSHCLALILSRSHTVSHTASPSTLSHSHTVSLSH